MFITDEYMYILVFLPRVCGELFVGDRLTRNLSALTFSGSCSRSSGVSDISVRLVEEEVERGGGGRRRWEDAKKQSRSSNNLKPLIFWGRKKRPADLCGNI